MATEREGEHHVYPPDEAHLPCPQCQSTAGSWVLKVLNLTDSYGVPYVHRQRRCAGCSYVFTTWEMLAYPIAGTEPDDENDKDEDDREERDDDDALA